MSTRTPSTRTSTRKSTSTRPSAERGDETAEWRIDDVTRRRALKGIALARAALDEARRATAAALRTDDAEAVGTAA